MNKYKNIADFIQKVISDSENDTTEEQWLKVLIARLKVTFFIEKHSESHVTNAKNQFILCRFISSQNFGDSLEFNRFFISKA